jgi:hypothetical protein
MKIRPVGAELFRAEGHDEATSRFWQIYERAQEVLTSMHDSKHSTE